MSSIKDIDGSNHICSLIDAKEDKHDLFLIFELGGKSISKELFEVKGEFFKGERIYSILHN